jgi:hypothetical protein
LTTDNDKIVFAQRQMHKAATTLANMSDAIAEARQIKEYDGDRRKRVLAAVMAEFLEQGESAAAAECKARASKYYTEQLLELGVQLRDAFRVIEKAEATRVLFSSAQSILSCEKAKLGL